MKLNFFKKKKTGWELSNLLDLIQNRPSELLNYSKSYPLCALNLSKNRFCIIRRFAARKVDGKIDTLNAPDFKGGEHYPIQHYGMTLISISKTGSSSHNVLLPSSLEFKKVELIGETLFIYHSNGLTTTNFKEINCLWTLHKLQEDEILNRFESLRNYVEPPRKVERHIASSIENDFFGKLTLNERLDWYEVSKDDISFSFYNTSLKNLTNNLEQARDLISLFDLIKNRMSEELLVLKNESWLEEGANELSLGEFKDEVNLYSVNIYQDGSSDLHYKANDLFWGHEIQTRIDKNNKYKSSTIAG